MWRSDSVRPTGCRLQFYPLEYDRRRAKEIEAEEQDTHEARRLEFRVIKGGVEHCERKNEW